eukprot:PhF_6_TR36192/c0_g1_i1/m.52764
METLLSILTRVGPMITPFDHPILHFIGTNKWDNNITTTATTTSSNNISISTSKKSSAQPQPAALKPKPPQPPSQSHNPAPKPPARARHNNNPRGVQKTKEQQQVDTTSNTTLPQIVYSDYEDKSKERHELLAAGNKNMVRARKAAVLPTRESVGMPSKDEEKRKEEELLKLRQRQALLQEGNKNMLVAKERRNKQPSSSSASTATELPPISEKHRLYLLGNENMRKAAMAAAAAPYESDITLGTSPRVQDELKKVREMIRKEMIHGKLVPATSPYAISQL